MKVLPTPFSTVALALAALLAAGPSVAAPDQQGATPGARAATRAAVVAYAKRREQTQQGLNADDAKSIQGVGQAVLAAQAASENADVDEALWQEMKSLHRELERTIASRSAPRFEGAKRTFRPASSPTVGAVNASPQEYAVTLKDGKPEARSVDVNRRSRTMKKDAAASETENGRIVLDRVAGLRSRLSGMQARINAADAAVPASDGGLSMRDRKAGVRRAGMVAKARQLRAEVQAAIDAKPSIDSNRQLIALRDRLHEKYLDETLTGQAAPAAVMPTLTTSNHLR